MPSSLSPLWAALPTPPSLATGPQALRDLIGWVCATHPERSRTLLRAPIWVSPALHAQLQPADLTAFKIFAKRIRVAELPPPGALPIQAPPLATPLALAAPLPLAAGTSLTTPAQIAQALHQAHAALSPLPPGSGPSVLALALDAAGLLLAWTRNQGVTRRDAHAEHVLIATLQAQGSLAAVAQIWVTLKPCRFCATLLYPLGVPITYLRDDPGPWGRATCLDAHSPDRRRFYPADSEQREIRWDESSGE